MTAQRILVVAALIAAVALVLLIPRGLETSSGETDIRPIELRDDRRAKPQPEPRAEPRRERRRERRRRCDRDSRTGSAAGRARAAAGRDRATRSRSAARAGAATSE
jgi:hypothetical protein